METLIAHPESEEKSAALKAFMKALKIPFKKSTYDPEFVKKIERSKADFKAGKSTVIKTKDLWK